MRKSWQLSKVPGTSATLELLAIITAVAVTLAGCVKATSEQPTLVPVRVTEVQTIDTGTANIYSANIEPYQQVDLSFKSNGYLASILQVRDAGGHMRNVDQGDYVTKGAVLATVQQDDYQQKLEQAKAQLARAQAENERAKLSFGRISALYAVGAATKPDYDDTNAQVQATQASVDNGKASVAEAEIALGYCELRAPFDAWVLKRNVDVGTLVGPATNGFTLADTRSVKAVFGVPDTAVGGIKPGSPESVTTEAMPGAFSGHVTSISAAADPKSRVYSVEVRIDNPGNRLKSGMIASISIGGGRKIQRVNAVPLTAVVRSPDNPNGFAVFVAEGTGDTVRVHTQDVKLGDTYGNLIAVLEGVNLKDRVVTSGTNMIKNGDEVRVIP
ncbi:MAG TPA: efflux RND transporter periplasmic adaptor subunit [Terriglobia bacterium]|nr:efflux RND transporter periplasmic adaptor subunit [Terriglobia bacterium]